MIPMCKKKNYRLAKERLLPEVLKILLSKISRGWEAKRKDD